MKGNHNTLTVTSRKVGIPPTNFKKHFEDSKEVIRIVYQRHTDNTMAKRTNNDLQSTTQKT